MYNQPENSRCQRPSVRSTSNCTNAPVSFSLSHGAVISQALRRITASLIRTAWPGFRTMSRTIPLRLLSSPSTATRCAMGVTPSWSAAERGTSMVIAFPAGCRSASSPRSQPPIAAAAARSMTIGNARTVSRVSMADNRRSMRGGSCRCRGSHPAGTPPSCRSDWATAASGTDEPAARPYREARRWSP